MRVSITKHKAKSMKMKRHKMGGLGGEAKGENWSASVAVQVSCRRLGRRRGIRDQTESPDFHGIPNLSGF